MSIRLSTIALSLAGIALGVAVSAWHGARPRPASMAGISLRASSRLLSNGTLEPGSVANSGELAAHVAFDASHALAAIPADLRPTSVQIELTPRYAPGVQRTAGLAYLSTARAIVVGDGGEAEAREVWLHELAHVRMAGSRPRGPIARSLLEAFEEGVADYFAASIAGSPRLGSGSEQRDLRAPPHVGASEWATLAFQGFDTHRMGWALAARFYALDPQGGSLLRDAVSCLDGESSLGSAEDSPAAAVLALLESCSEQGRVALTHVLHGWLPAEFYSVEIPT